MQSTRRFEMGLPLFGGLDLGLIMGAQVKLKSGDFQGLSAMVETLGKAGALHTIRKLAAIWTASKIELKEAESNPAIMAELEDRAAAAPFAESFKAAMDFQSALWERLGVTPDSSDATGGKKTKGKQAQDSAASPSGA